MARHSFDATREKGMQKDYTVKEYTPEECAIDLIKLVPIEKNDSVLDCSSGEKKVFFDNFPTKNKKELEVERGEDYLQYDRKVDWVISNPPFTLFVKFLYKSSMICNKGFGFLINHSRLNQVTPKRLADMELKGFYLNKFHIFGVNKWFGRYYFLLFTKERNKGINYSRWTYGGKRKNE